MTPTDEQIRLAIAEQAADWFVAHRTDVLDGARREAFAQWLKASPVHVDEYLRMAAISADLAEAARDPQLPADTWIAEASSPAPVGEGPGTAELVPSANPANGVSPRRDPESARNASRSRRWASGWRLAGALAIPAIAVAAVIVTVLLSWNPAQAYATAHGEQRTWQLADGTTVRLNTDSAIEVRFSGSERVVDLSRGQAYFKVAHSAHRRFRVVAGKANVIAVGTRFDVYRHGRTIQVTVLSGRVAIVSGHAPPPSGAALPDGALYLVAGQQVQIVGGAIEGPSRVDLQQAESWLHGQIAFGQRPLGEVVAEFNRYAKVPIEIVDPSLRTVRVSGVFDDGDSVSFLAFVQTLRKGIVIQTSANRIRVFRRPTGSMPAGPASSP